MVELYQGDCLETMLRLDDKSIDLILADLPYGTTACKWDTVIPFDLLWTQYKRIRKFRAATVLFGTQPFTSLLITSNLKEFKYTWTWDKQYGRGHLVAKVRPMQQSEDVVIFGKGGINYYPQMTERDIPIVGTGEKARTTLVGGKKTRQEAKVYTHKYPTTILNVPWHNRGQNYHPTQKPVSLLEYLIKTYTQEFGTVLDNTMGSGSTGIACINTNRNFIGIELDEHCFQVAKERIEEAQIKVSEKLF